VSYLKQYGVSICIPIGQRVHLLQTRLEATSPAFL
jgi:hypothetical protein